ncbi:hypothetical protein [Natronoglycomyces albus]|uniref:Uncharacterized protein n=1 Tax=Natronoglycomyces albus TaxID=2811108 RepID=A0A895XGV2_9ACTN|nr:hypothetical protein [Natronoglycomyces albus]QSB05081.1 hypothetical protein JQS30_15180 [Natronoglycomyces albus]
MAVHDENQIPPALLGFIDDAAVFPPGNAELEDALNNHRDYRASWYEPLVGPLLLPATKLPRLLELWKSNERLRIGLIGDTGIDGVAGALDSLPDHIEVAQVETRAADTAALHQLIGAAKNWGVPAYAEISPVDDLTKHLEILAETNISPKFRTGGIPADLLPTPDVLARVIISCAQLGLNFKLTAGLHHAIRHIDPATGAAHHGFANVLAGVYAAIDGADIPDVADILHTSTPDKLAAAIRPHLNQDRPLWVGFGSCSVLEPLEDLTELSLVKP